jgi:hypothetical protein
MIRFKGKSSSLYATLELPLNIVDDLPLLDEDRISLLSSSISYISLIIELLWLWLNRLAVPLEKDIFPADELS